MPKQSLGFFEGPDSPEALKSSLRRTHLRSSSMPSSQDSELPLHVVSHRTLSSLSVGAAHNVVLMLCVVSTCLLKDQSNLHNYKNRVRSCVCIRLGSGDCCTQLDYKCDGTLPFLLYLQC